MNKQTTQNYDKMICEFRNALSTLDDLCGEYGHANENMMMIEKRSIMIEALQAAFPKMF
jgi:hypothetical protein